MAGVNALLQTLNQRINARSLRERIIITVTALVALFFGWSALLLDQQAAEISSLKKAIDQETSAIQSMQLIQKSISEQLASDPNRAEQLRLERYRAEAERIDKELSERTLEFISPQQMVEVLKDLIRKEQGLRLVSLESIPPEDPLQDMKDGAGEPESGAESKSAVEEPSGAYLHTLQLRFRGDYINAMRYIQHLESLQWRFIWKSVSIQLEEYPVTNVELQLQTLGLTEGWIGV